MTVSPHLFVLVRRALIPLFMIAGSSAAYTASSAPAQSRFVLYGSYSNAVNQQAATPYTPSDIANAYSFSPLYSQGIQGQGQTVALIEADALQTKDLAYFDQNFNLPAPSIKTTYVGGKKFSLPTTEETTLDVEWLHALAPGAKIQIYYLKNNQTLKAGWKSFASAITTATNSGAHTISISLGVCDPTSSKPMQTALASALAKNVSVFSASGDSGDHPGPKRDCGNSIGVAYPASDPSVVAVGGTSLQLSSTDSILDEVAWNLSGGGVSSFTRPLWQTATQLPGDTFRWVPDVSFLADQNTGVAVRFKNRWHQVGGTSLGAPAWAATWTLLRQDAAQHNVSLSAAPTELYQLGNSSLYSSVFHDITTGSNGQYSAGPGWDAVTGWGTPDVANMAAAITSPTTSSSTTP